MDDMQMEKLIAGIRENESKSQSLSETLIAFNESFTRFMAQIEAVGKLREFEVSHEKIISLEENIAGIKEDIELINTAQMVRLNELGRELEGKLKNEFKEALKSELKAELLNGFEKILDKKFSPSTETSLVIGGKVYSIDASRKAIVVKDIINEKDQVNKGVSNNAENAANKVAGNSVASEINKVVGNNREGAAYSSEKQLKVYESEVVIRGISRAYDSEHKSRILVHLENGEVHII